MVLLALAVGVAACDLDVLSPATVDEETLDSENSIEALWSGILGQVSHIAAGRPGAGGFFVFGALRTDELVHSGHPDQFPQFRFYSDGSPIPNDLPGVDELWGQAMMTRYVSEFGVERSRSIYEAYKDHPLTRIRDQVTRDRIRLHAWAGIAFRMLGDNLCHAVNDGGAPQPHTVYYDRALEVLDEGIAFAEANQVADVDEFGVRAAYAARAQVRMMLGDWAGAAADAAQVETGFNGLAAGYTTVEPDLRQYNWFRFVDFLDNAFAHPNGGGGRNTTLWGTPFAQWGFNSSQNSGADRRVTFTLHRTNANPHREFGGDARRPWLRPSKQLSTTGNALFYLADGKEMRLIEAEARLVAGDWQGAIDKINELREWYNAPTGARFEQFGYPLPMLAASSEDEAWELLMRERGIELWLTGRRLPDIRRWSVSPGWVNTEVAREVTAGAPSNDPVRNVLDISGEFCFPIGATEVRLNPNL
jgi:starch-binding outer membrane protein, SusD/RagB family